MIILEIVLFHLLSLYLKEIHFLGKYNDVNFVIVNQNIERLDENIRKIWNILRRIQKQQKEAVEPQKENKVNHFDLKSFKFRKSSLVMRVLGLSIFLSLFCMKQQNDYALLNQEHCRQSVNIKEKRSKVDSLKNNAKLEIGDKRIVTFGVKYSFKGL